ncbi:MAG: phosphatase PAP2 family protein [Polyangiales bacterium]
MSNLAAQDFLSIAFHSYMLARAFAAPNSMEASLARVWAATLFSVSTTAIVLARGEVLPKGKLRSFVYRVGIFTPMVLSYFELRYLLPGLQPHLLDDQLHALDRAIFGITPALWLNRFNQLPRVEWISFFYYSYFYLMGLMLIPSLLFDGGRRLHELMVGALIVCGGGHFIYTLVPGAGPYASMQFPEPLHGGFWWHQVQVTVANAGAQLDIFPSLHTAYPTFFSLFAFGNRHEKPYKYVWPIVAFFTVNMVTATMFLRWHWGVDVIAGLTLATVARISGIVVSRAEASRGTGEDERQIVWEPLVR